MTKTEKETLYNLLQTSQNFYRGFLDKNEVMPEFKNDEEKSKMTLDLLKEKVFDCSRCNLSKTRTKPVFGVGVSNPDVLVIGEKPGGIEDSKGEPFIGESGILLDKMLGAINLSRNTNCYIANIVKCRTPANRDPFIEEKQSCINFIQTQIHLLKPKMILCLGEISANALLKSSEKIENLRGKFLDYKGIPLLTIYHPKLLLQNPEFKRNAWEDLKLFRRNLDQLLNS